MQALIYSLLLFFNFMLNITQCYSERLQLYSVFFFMFNQYVFIFIMYYLIYYLLFTDWYMFIYSYLLFFHTETDKMLGRTNWKKRPKRWFHQFLKCTKHFISQYFNLHEQNGCWFISFSFQYVTSQLCPCFNAFVTNGLWGFYKLC